MRLEIVPLARADLRNIGDYIAAESPARALSFVAELRKACAGLVESPFRFAAMEGFAHRGYRRCIYGRYAIVYVVTDDVVSVIRVLSVAQDFNEALS
jgi:toxin ParE1/3/4